MNENITDLFRKEAQKILETKNINRTDFAVSIGYSLNSLNNILKKKNTNVQFDNLVLFCKKYGFDLDFFIKNKEYIRDESQPTTVREMFERYELDNLKISDLENQFLTLLKANASIRELFKTGISFSEVQNNNILNLKKMVGI